MDDDDRTNAIGLFNFAHSYAASAVMLSKNRPADTTHPEAPIDFLAFHAIELYLKAFLRAHGLSVAGIKKVGHKLTALRNKAQALGLSVVDENGVIDLAEMSMMERRYIVTGAKQRHPAELVFEVLRHLHHEVGEELRRVEWRNGCPRSTASPDPEQPTPVNPGVTGSCYPAPRRLRCRVHDGDRGRG